MLLLERARDAQSAAGRFISAKHLAVLLKRKSQGIHDVDSVSVSKTVLRLRESIGRLLGADRALGKVVVDRVQFKIPGDMTTVAVYGVDSFVGEWKSSDVSLYLDLGTSSDPLGYDAKDAFRITLTTIDGKQATIERFMDDADPQHPYVAAIHFADLGDGQKLTLFGRAATEDDQDVLMAIYKTLQFEDAEEA